MKLMLKIIGGTLGVATVAGFTTTMVIVNKHHEEKVALPNTTDDNNNPNLNWNHKTIHRTKKKGVRVANWNLANFSGSYKRVQAMSNIISDAQISILGAEEVDNVAGLYKIAKKLNENFSGSFPWKVVYSKLAEKAKDGKKMGALGAGEYYGFIYNSNEVRVKPFTDGTIGKLYENPWVENEYLKNIPSLANKGGKAIMSSYVRPPFGVQFEHRDYKTQKTSDFTAVIAHFDSPGHKTKTAKPTHLKNHLKTPDATFEVKATTTVHGKHMTKYLSTVGSQEAFEAEHLSDVMKFFNDVNGDDNDMLFMGDTNIPNYSTPTTKTKKNAFEGILSNGKGYKELMDPNSFESATSLSKNAFSESSIPKQKGHLYVNSYDKMISNTSQFIPNTAKRYEIGKVFNNGVVEADDFGGNKYGNIASISDHTLVYADYDMEKLDSDVSSEKSAWPPYHDVDINIDSYFKLVTQAGLSPEQAMRVIYYRKLVGNIDSAQKLDSIIKYYDKYWDKIIGKTDKLSFITHSHFIYDTPSIKTGDQEIRRESREHITKIEKMNVSKIDINKVSALELSRLVKIGLIDKQTMFNVIKKRSGGAKINSYDDIKNTKNPLPNLYSKVLEFNSSNSPMKNPFDFNKATFDEMISMFASKDSPFALSSYHIAAIVSQRQRELIDDDVLLKTIGKYAFDKMPSGLVYSNSAGILNELKSKININKATRNQFIKFVGARFGTKIFNLIQNHAKDNPGTHRVEKHGIGISSFDSLDSIHKISYAMEQLKIIFKIDPADKDVLIWEPRATYTFSELQAEAKKVDLSLSAHDLYHSQSFVEFTKYINSNNGPDKVSGKYKETKIGTFSDALIKSIIKAIRSSATWDLAYKSLKSSEKYGTGETHKSEYILLYNWMRPTDSSIVVYVDPSLGHSVIKPQPIVTTPTIHHTSSSSKVEEVKKIVVGKSKTAAGKALSGFMVQEFPTTAGTGSSGVEKISSAQMRIAAQALALGPNSFSDFLSEAQKIRSYSSETSKKYDVFKLLFSA